MIACRAGVYDGRREVLAVLARLTEKQSAFVTVGDLIERNPKLADEPLLEYFDGTVLVEAFISRVLRLVHVATTDS